MAKRILAVDDEQHILQIVKFNLEKAGYEVTTATNGREALEAVQAQRPDLIVMDVMMPEMDGLEALRTLKGDESTREIPVVMLTANEEEADVFEGWKSGAHAYLNKPFNLRELLAFIEGIFKDDGGKKTYEIIETS